MCLVKKKKKQLYLSCMATGLFSNTYNDNAYTILGQKKSLIKANLDLTLMVWQELFCLSLYQYQAERNWCKALEPWLTALTSRSPASASSCLSGFSGLLWASLGTFQQQPAHDAFTAGALEVPKLRLNPSWKIFSLAGFRGGMAKWQFGGSCNLSCQYVMIKCPLRFLLRNPKEKGHTEPLRFPNATPNTVHLAFSAWPVKNGY